MHQDILDVVPEEVKPRAKEDIDREYSHYALLAGDAYIKMKHHEKLMNNFKDKATLVIKEAEELDKQKKLVS